MTDQSSSFRLTVLALLVAMFALPQALPAHFFPSSVTKSMTQAMAHKSELPVKTEASPEQTSAPTFDSSVLDLSEKDVDFRKDWWKYAIMLITFSVAAFLLTKVAKQIIHLAIILLCIAFSGFSAYLAGPALGPALAKVMPCLDMKHFPALYWAYLICFLVAYLIAILLLRLLRKPIAEGETSKKKDA